MGEGTGESYRQGVDKKRENSCKHEYMQMAASAMPHTTLWAPLCSRELIGEWTPGYWMLLIEGSSRFVPASKCRDW